jgi:hypothetical protein
MQDQGVIFFITPHSRQKDLLMMPVASSIGHAIYICQSFRVSEITSHPSGKNSAIGDWLSQSDGTEKLVLSRKAKWFQRLPVLVNQVFS